MTDKTEKFHELKNQGFDDVLISKMMDDPDLEQAVISMAAKAKANDPKIKIQKQIDLLRNTYDQLNSKEFKTLEDFAMLMKIKREIVDNENEMLKFE